MTALATGTESCAEGFRHEALLYRGERGFAEGTLPFIRDGVGAGEPVLVVVGAEKIGGLRDALGEDAERVCFADMADVGANPARIIPAWRDFVDAHGRGRAMRGIGEPICPTRSSTEMAECHRHEALLNLAFADTPDFWLLCPYDVEALDPAVIAEAQRTHPLLVEGRVAWESPHYQGLEAVAGPFDEPLPEPPGPVEEIAFDGDALRALRRTVALRSAAAVLEPRRAEDFVGAVNEAAANSVRHAGGRGVLRIWEDADALVCEVRDVGQIRDPLVGRERPPAEALGGWGVWLANQLCDLVQIRTLPAGSVTRLHMRREPPLKVGATGPISA